MQDGKTVLMYAVERETSMEVVELLLAKGADITDKDEVRNF